MTFRDCTLFVQVPKELISMPEETSPPGTDVQQLNHNAIFPPQKSNANPRPIRIVLADLDEKSEANRGDYWKSLEDSLIAGGYYLGHGKLDPTVEDCDLTDVVWTSDQVKWNGHAF